MYKELTIVTGEAPSQLDKNLSKISRFLGIPVRFQPVCEMSPEHDYPCVAVSAGTLEQLNRDNVRTILKSQKVFIAGIDAGMERNDVLRTITGGSVQSIGEIESDTYCVSDEKRDFCRQFSGLEFGPTDPGNDRIFHLDEGSAVDSLIVIGGKPSLIKIQNTDQEVFVLGSRQIADLDTPIHRDSQPVELFSQLVPLMMFVRYVFGDQCWHSEKASACFIIDDPWLRRNYGFVEYGELLGAMRRKRFTTSIAFIPWNYRRSRKDVVKQFRSNSKFLSLSVHGCDHNEGEFGVDDAELLHHKIKTALRRMKRHEELTGLGFDPVMVFPQGVFSTAALRVLDESSFLAAVNSDAFPVDQEDDSIPLRCFLDTTMSHFEGVALFTRHYPFETAKFALDLFLGKPVLAVEHHEFFKHGCGELEEFVDRINSMDQQIEWLSLGDVAKQTALQRRTEKGAEIRMYTNECSIRNRGSEVVGFQAATLRRGERKILEVTVNGKAVEFVEKIGWVHFKLVIAADSVAEVNVVYETVSSVAKSYRPSQLERSKIAARRYLCDFRDNHLVKSEMLLKLSKSAKRKLFNRGVASLPK